MNFGFLIDTTLCIGCEACMDACHEIHHQPATENYELSAKNLTVVKNKTVENEDIYYRRMCMHCDTPSCVSVCPVAAFEKTKEGPVIYDASKCMGCRYCLIACPFDVPKYEWSKANPKVIKCDMCYHRIQQGLQPACAEACPTGATLFGKRDELIEVARERIKSEPEKYYPYIYGVSEVGGTSVLLLSSIPLDELGFKSKNYQEAFPKFTWQAMKEIPNVVTFGGVFMYGLWWIINRRMELQKLHADDEFLANEEEKNDNH
jgi:formate dehydrogenase iron-sulfur subunit